MPITAFEEDKPRPHIETLAIGEIKQDREIAAREIDTALVCEYTERMAAGEEFPPVTVMRDKDGVNWLFEGWHRLAAARARGLEGFSCEIHQGDRREALLASASVNATHGQRRSDLDKQKAVLKLLSDAEWGKWSDREIACHCRVSHNFVRELRVRASPAPNASDHRRVYRNKHGGVAQMNIDRIQASNRARSNVVQIESAAAVKDVATHVVTVAYVRDAKPTFEATDLLRLEDRVRDIAELAKKAKYAIDKTLARDLLAVSKQLPKIAAKLEQEAARLMSPAPARRKGAHTRRKKSP